MPDPPPVPDVACPGCGRAYAADRFPLGRTFRCACGERVGLHLPRDLPAPGEEPRFLADVMLGKLARWLRALGYDAAWEPEIADEALVRRGIEERRLILTRDRGLAADWWVEGVILIRSDRPLEQLREVAEAVGLSRERLFTRCTHCNAPLRPAPASEVEARIPPEIRSRYADFRACPSCGRIYWKGGHVERMRRAIDEALG